MLKEPTRRIRFLTRDEAKRLLVALPEHLADMAAFSLATGLRRANVTGLQWTQVDLVRRIAWVHPDQAKARKAIAVPLNAEAVLLIRNRLGKHPTHVFSFRGRPIVQVSSKAWYVALEAAGIEDFRWHDLRHTWGELACAARNALFRLAGAGRLKARRWCGVTRTSRLNISPRTRIVYALCGLWKLPMIKAPDDGHVLVTARNEKGLALAKPLD